MAQWRGAAACVKTGRMSRFGEHFWLVRWDQEVLTNFVKILLLQQLALIWGKECESEARSLTHRKGAKHIS